MNERRVNIRPMSLLRFLPRAAVVMAIATLAAFLVAFLGLRLVEGDQRVEAKALIVARNLTVSIDELPDTVDVIYERVGVGSRAKEIGDIQIDALELTDRVEVVVVASTPTIIVIGRDANPADAARYANAVGEALVAVLNETGAVGEFSIVEPASASRAEPEPGLPVEPIAILAGLLAGMGVLVAAFLLRQPIYRLADVAAVSSCAVSEEVWVSPTPPVEGKVRPLATQLGTLGSHWRLVHCGWGEDLTQPLESLLLKQAPQLRFISEDLAADLPSESPWRIAVVAPEGTPASILREAEEHAGPRLAVVALLHPRLA